LSATARIRRIPVKACPYQVSTNPSRLCESGSRNVAEKQNQVSGYRVERQIDFVC
jgi:hypothetical protein